MGVARIVGMTPKLRPQPWLCLLICFQSITVCGRAQAAAADPKSILRKELMGQQLILRNMSAATKIRGSWDGHAASLDQPPWRTFAALTVHKIQLKGTQVNLEATRNQIVRDKSGKLGLSSVATPVTLTLTLEGDPATLAPTLHDAVFFPSLDAALAAVPKAFQKAIPPQPGAVKDPATRLPVCDCTNTTGTCRAENGSGRPKVLYSVEPEFSEEARRSKTNGSVEVGIQLDETGVVADEWLVRDLGYGLDQQAAIAVSKYKFAPATCHGTPIGTTIFVQVNFQIH
jgi:Gram-negative bacterial TonB protein C-terminal